MPMTLSRSILTILIPGLVAVAPWLLAVYPLVEKQLALDKNATVTNAVIFAVAAIMGSVCERRGTSQEVAWDEEREGEYAVEENWYSYLAQSFDPEPVGYRYLSRLVTSLYFELAMSYSGPIFFVGAGVLFAARFGIDYWIVSAVPAMVGAVWSNVFFFGEAKKTHEVLCKTRRELMARWAEAERGTRPNSFS